VVDHPVYADTKKERSLHTRVLFIDFKLKIEKLETLW